MTAKGMFYPEDKEFSVAEERAFAREELVYNVTEDILVALEDMGIAKNELARRLGKSKAYVTQILSGVRNMTLGTLSDICFALEVKPKVIVDSNYMSNHIVIDEDNNWSRVGLGDWTEFNDSSEEKFWSGIVELNTEDIIEKYQSDTIPTLKAESIIDYKNNDKCIQKWKSCDREVA